MDKYLLLRSELKIIADALEEYRERHCAKDCCHLQNCLCRESCQRVASDLGIYGELIGGIRFFDDEPLLHEAVAYLDKTEGHVSGVRWLPDLG